MYTSINFWRLIISLLSILLYSVNISIACLPLFYLVINISCRCWSIVLEFLSISANTSVSTSRILFLNFYGNMTVRCCNKCWYLIPLNSLIWYRSVMNPAYVSSNSRLGLLKCFCIKYPISWSCSQSNYHSLLLIKYLPEILQTLFLLLLYHHCQLLELLAILFSLPELIHLWIELR